MKRTLAAAALAAVIALAGCAPAGSIAQAPTPTATTDAADGVTPEPSPTEGTPTPTPTPSTLDLALQIKDLVGRYAAENVMRADLVESDRIEVWTGLVDPRTEGSLEALTAIEICEAAVALGAAKVVVYESDGTTWILYGHPSYGDVCAEV